MCFFSTIALCKLLQHAIEKNDQRFQNIEVKGDQIFNYNEGIRTRSKSVKSGCSLLPILLVRIQNFRTTDMRCVGVFHFILHRHTMLSPGIFKIFHITHCVVIV